MRKQELVQLHALYVVVRARFEEHRDVPPEAFRSYEDYDVTPTAIHRNKRAHKEAIDRLFDGLSAVIEADQSSKRRANLSGEDD
jgi:hypothetical protein